MQAALRIENVSKYYRLAVGGSVPYGTLREKIMGAVGAPVRRLREMSGGGAGEGEEREGTEGMWALRGVSFDVAPGEAVAIIGRNGAGKSTLLKILSRITAPTSGRARLHGRVGSLLEVGTGFHPELTGRENILLNGAILGMSRREVMKKFDQIVAFAEVSRFLDVPVKRYSSGMYTRLAFAVASHLEPEILIVDEVLAVGDVAFQKKCLGRMDEVTRSGRTVLFVSHNMTAVKSLCTRAIMLEAGRVSADGDTDTVVNRYLTAGTEMSRTGVIPDNAPRFCDCPGEARLRSVRLTDGADNDLSQLSFKQPVRVEFDCDVFKDLPADVHFEVSISTREGTQVTYSTTIDGGREPMALPKGRHRVTAEIDMTLLPGQYSLDLGIHHHDGRTIDFVQRTLDFSVLSVAESGTDHYKWGRVRGFVRGPARWDVDMNVPPAGVAPVGAVAEA